MTKEIEEKVKEQARQWFISTDMNLKDFALSVAKYVYDLLTLSGDVQERAKEYEYVCGFLFDSRVQDVVLIWKEKPAWQKGKLNGVGGKIEKGESGLTAMRREFKEETGLDVDNWEPLIDVSGNDWVVHFYCAKDDKNQINYAETREQEEVAIIDNDRLSDFAFIPNLEWLVPMAKHKLKNRGEIIAGNAGASGMKWVSPETELPEPHRLVWIKRDRGVIYIGYRLNKPLSTNPDPSSDCWWYGNNSEDMTCKTWNYHFNNSFSDVTVTGWAYVKPNESGASDMKGELEALKAENERLRSLFTEFVVRTQRCFPVTEEQLKWFEEETNCKLPHVKAFMRNVFETLGLTGTEPAENTSVRFPHGK